MAVVDQWSTLQFAWSIPPCFRQPGLLQSGMEPPDPTPAEIRRACEAIRRSWSPGERARRWFIAHHDDWEGVHAGDVEDLLAYQIPVVESPTAAGEARRS